MKQNPEFILREIANNTVLVPFGQRAVDMNGIVTLNETAKFLWNICQSDVTVNDLEKALKTEYGIDDATAKNATETFVAKMKEIGCLND